LSYFHLVSSGFSDLVGVIRNSDRGLSRAVLNSTLSFWDFAHLAKLGRNMLRPYKR
jgi:hypothetical protein